MAKRNAPKGPAPYQHQEFPKMLYAIDDKSGKRIEKIVDDPDEMQEAVNEGWVESPADLEDVDMSDSLEARQASEIAELKAQLQALLEAQAEEPKPKGGKGSKKADAASEDK